MSDSHRCIKKARQALVAAVLPALVACGSDGGTPVGVLPWGQVSFHTGVTLTYSYEGNAFGTSLFGPEFQERSFIRGGVTLEFLGAGTYGIPGGSRDFDTISDWAFGVTFALHPPPGGFAIHDETPGLVQSNILISLDAAGNVVAWDVTVRAPVPAGGPDLFLSIKDFKDDAIANIGTPEVSSGSVRAPGSWGVFVPDPNNPELPDGIVDCGPTCFDFRNGFSGNWFDPTPVTQYTYVAEPGTLFTGVELPPNFDDNFVLSALGCSFAPSYSSLTFIDLVALCGEAIPSFTVSGISPPADADDPLGFPTRLTFNNLLGSFSMFGSQIDVSVRIDIKPGGDPNSINTKSKGVIPVAILTTAVADGDASDFDATTVDPLSVTFGPGAATEKHNKGHLEDVDGDGDTDLVLHFPTQDSGLAVGDTEACLDGMTFGGQAIHGCDAVNIVK